MDPNPSLTLSASEGLPLDTAAERRAALVGAFERYHAEVFRYLRAMSSDPDDAADLAAATFERAFRSLGMVRAGPDGFRPWLFRIARNLAIDADRRRASARRGLRFWPPAASAPDPADLVVRDEEDRQLARAVSDLPRAQREAVVLRFAGGLTAREIGDVLGRSEAAAHKLMNRALHALKEAYRDQA